MMFSERSAKKEIMDDFSITDERIQQALRELKVINRFLGGQASTERGLRCLVNNENRGQPLKILDIGSGDSENFTPKTRNGLSLFCLDINEGVCRYTKVNDGSKTVICGDALQLPFRGSVFDVVHASLFFHHLAEVEIISLIKSGLGISRHGMIINDLQRSVFAWAGIKILTMLFSRSKMVRNDGPLSVRRGFTKTELINVLNKAGCTNYKIEYRWAFRWLVIIKKEIPL